MQKQSNAMAEGSKAMAQSKVMAQSKGSPYLATLALSGSSETDNGYGVSLRGELRSMLANYAIDNKSQKRKERHA